jgi:hypothetical protein
MDLYFRLKNFITNWNITGDDISDLLETLKDKSIMTLWCLRKKLNGKYDLYFGFDGPFTIDSDAERQDLIKKLDEEYLHPKK